MSYIFLSYAKADRDAAFAMRDVLRREGLSSVWMDENFHELNNEHWPLIEANILSAAAFVLLLSDAAKESKWVERELSYAEKIQKPIFSILIQGEAWERLQYEPLRPTLGASLDLPDEFAALIKTLDAPYANLPEQIRADTVKPAGKVPYKMAISIAIVVAIVFLLLRMASSFISDRQASQEMTEIAASTLSAIDALNRQSTATAVATESYEASETAAANATDTRIAAIIGNSYATSTMMAVRTERVTLTANAENARNAVSTREADFANSTATEIAATGIVMTALAPTVFAADTQQASTVIAANTQQASTLIATANTQQANMNLTAIAGNGTLPCSANVRMAGTSIFLTVYAEPDRDADSERLRYSVAYTLTLTEWLVNSEGVWYGFRLFPSDLETYAYIPAEDLILDEACPR